MSSDIRKWFMKSHDKAKAAANSKDDASTKPNSKPTISLPEKPVQGGHESSTRRKTSKYFSSDNQKLKDEKEVEEPSSKRKFQKGSGELSSEAKPSPGKKLRKVDDDNDDDFVLPNSRKASDEVTPSKKLKSSSGRGISKKSVDINESDEDDADGANTKSSLKSAGRGRGGKSAASSAVGMNIDEDDEDEADKKPLKSSGRGRGGRGGASAAPAGGRGRGGGGGRGGFMNFGERKDPPHKGEKVLNYFYLTSVYRIRIF